MGRGITVKSCYGWIIDSFDGTYPEGLEGVMTDEQMDDLDEAVEATLEHEMIDCEVEPFGYEYRGCALVAKGSTTTKYDYDHALADFQPDKRQEPAFARELEKALDALGWRWPDGGLGKPQWLLLVAYG